MTSASISEAKAKLSALLDKVRAGEEVTITARGVPIAKIVPLAPADVDWDARLDRLERQGLIRRPKRKLDVDAFLAEPPIDLGGGVVELLLQERREGR
jgi:prevent-host-death family protein